MKQTPVNIKNKRATFDYELVETYTAGIVLTGTEIKSIRQGKASLADTYCIFEKGELWVRNMYIAEYFYGTYNNHNVRRDRKPVSYTHLDVYKRQPIKLVLFKCAFHCTFVFFFFDRLTFVVLLFASCHGDVELCQSSFVNE